ncbi:outer membrane protein assembly factor BamB [Salinisphaera sp. P385]|uniref:Outer membrane protein assembly factor BamB n=1 Tax=Spectribacter acetivorans TaxID=3075603 RepID=A0ABU3B9J6_9GAMM|nr:outer membrane protein assembly factor BamB [Salinisphaera sp. P385]MDT0619146.1 outer membrane protein assembly factor BamB [Salinisphaera sp. P385]
MRVLAGLTILAAGLLAGCASDGGALPEPSPLPDLDRQLIDGEVLWRRSGGNGAGDKVSGFRLALDGARVYTANRNGRVSAINIEDGSLAWRADTELRLVSGPVHMDGRLLVGTRDGELVALSAEDGSRQWAVTLSSELLVPPAAGNGTVVARSLDGRIVALELATGERRWTVERQVPTLTLRGGSAPLIDGDAVYAGLDSGKVLALSLSTGEQLWEQRIAAPAGRTELERVVDVDAELLLADGVLYAASVGDRLVSLALSSGRVRWSRDIGSRTGLTFNPGQLFVTDRSSHVLATNRRSGATIWNNEALAYRNLTQPVMYKSYVMVADYEGYLHWMIPEDGTPIGYADVMGEPIRSAPIVVGDRILLLGAEGTVVAVEGIFPDDADD